MSRTSARRADAGFTLLEALIVIAIIGIISATGLPMVLNYMRHFKIRGAAQELASAIQQGRTKAITKSSQWGVVFAIENLPTPGEGQKTYWVHTDDDQTLPRQGAAVPLNLVVNQTEDGKAQSTRRLLPPGIVFANAGQCAPTPALAPAFNPAAGQIRFNRLGASCAPTGATGPCPVVNTPGGALANLIENRAAFSLICLLDRSRQPPGLIPIADLSRWIRIERGGRVEVQQ